MLASLVCTIEIFGIQKQSPPIVFHLTRNDAKNKKLFYSYHPTTLTCLVLVYYSCIVRSSHISSD